MSSHTFLLADCTQPEFTSHHLNFDTTGIRIEGSTDWSIRSFQYSYGPSQGVHQVSIQLGDVCVNVLPTRGMGVLNAFVKRHRLGWDSPVRFPVHPALVNQHGRNKLGWLDGFNELVCRCGLNFNGPPGFDSDNPSPLLNDLTLHGNISNTPAYWVECTISESQHKTGSSSTACHISLKGKVLESSLFGPHLELTSTITMTLGENGFTLEDEILNLGTSPGEVELLYHVNVGDPFAGDGTEFHAPVSQVVPRDSRAAEGTDHWSKCLPPTQGYAEQVYFCKVLPDKNGIGKTLLENRQQNLGLKLSFNTTELPCFAFWKNTQAKSDGYCVGLEPAINLPNFKSYERNQGRVLKLPYGEKYRTSFKLEVLDQPESLDHVKNEIKKIQADIEAVISSTPQPGWSTSGG